MIYRPKSEKLHKRDSWENDEDVNGEVEAEDEEKLFESDIEDAHRFSEDSMYEWRTGIIEVSRIISNEALEILYGQNAFIVDIHGECYRNSSTSMLPICDAFATFVLWHDPWEYLMESPWCLIPSFGFHCWKGCCSSVLWHSSHWRLEATTMLQLLRKICANGPLG